MRVRNMSEPNRGAATEGRPYSSFRGASGIGSYDMTKNGACVRTI